MPYIWPYSAENAGPGPSKKSVIAIYHDASERTKVVLAEQDSAVDSPMAALPCDSALVALQD